MPDLTMVLVLGVLAAAVAGGLAWRTWAPRSFWYAVVFPLRFVHVYLTWGHVASGVGLSRKRRRLRLSLEPLPVAGPVAEVVRYRRRARRVEVDRAPRLGLMRPTPFGWRVRVRLCDGQNPDDYIGVADRFAHAWRVHAVRVSSPKPGRVMLDATVRDPLLRVSDLPDTGELLRVVAGRLETGAPWVLCFRTVPHWLNAGATQSGKSNLANAVIRGLAPQPVALVGFDLKGGVEFTPYAPRLSALATTRAESVTLLDDLVRALGDRMRRCRAHGARDVWRLPDEVRPIPVVVLVDEVAELFLMADKTEKDEVTKTATGLLRVAQLGRAFGVYLFVCGQRIGSDLGPGVTALRAQLSGRICHRVNDPETANMTLGDMDAAALDAARKIPAETPGVAVVAGQDGHWHRSRSVLVGEAKAEEAARTYAHLTPAWADITATGPMPLDPGDEPEAA